MSLPGGVSWVPGTAGASQTCGEVCADAPEVGDCANEALAACWLDDTCATHAAAREDAGAAASTTCVECGPTEWMDDGNAYCYPGVISGGSSGVAYWGASIVRDESTLCEAVYDDARVQPLCPCLLPAGLGWTIVWSIVGGLLLYTVGGWGWGRYRSSPPREGDGCLAHPDGYGAAAWHPHYDALCELEVLVRAGCHFFFSWVDAKRRGVAFEYEQPSEVEDAEKGGLLERGDLEPPAAKKERRRKSERKERKERKSKPKPKQQSKAAAVEQPPPPPPTSLGLREVAEVDEDTHSSMARIKVVLEAPEPPELEPEPEPRSKRKSSKSKKSKRSSP